MNATYYHRTTPAAAEAILATGFRDATGSYMLEDELTGVFISDVPLDMNEGAKATAVNGALLAIEIGAELVEPYEIVEDGRSFREFCVPAEALNAHGDIRLLTEAEADEADERGWEIRRKRAGIEE